MENNLIGVTENDVAAITYKKAKVGMDGLIIGLLLGLFFNVIGWIISYFIHKNLYDSDEYEKAKGVKVGSLISVVIILIASLLLTPLVLSLLKSNESENDPNSSLASPQASVSSQSENPQPAPTKAKKVDLKPFVPPVPQFDPSQSENSKSRPKVAMAPQSAPSQSEEVSTTKSYSPNDGDKNFQKSLREAERLIAETRKVDPVQAEIYAAQLEVIKKNREQAISQGYLTACKSNLKNIGTACEMYAYDHHEKYPPTIFDLKAEGYLKRIPTCPVTGKDTYSISYQVSRDSNGKEIFKVCCQGHNHAKADIQKDFPKYDSVQGLTEN